MITCKSNNSTHLYLFLPYFPDIYSIIKILLYYIIRALWSNFLEYSYNIIKFQGFSLSYRVSLYHDVPHMARKSPETVYSVFTKVLSSLFYPRYPLCLFLITDFILLSASLLLTSRCISFFHSHHICMNGFCNNIYVLFSVLHLCIL